MRQIKDVQDRRTKEKVYIRTHIKAVVTDDSGSTLEDYLGSDLIGRLVSLEDLIQRNGDGEAFLANDGTYKYLNDYLTKNEASATYVSLSPFNDLKDRVNTIETDFVRTIIFEQALGLYSTTGEVQEMLNGKVDKDGNKQLSTEDFTTQLKEKLEGLQNYNDTAIKNSISNLENKVAPTTALTTFMEGASFVNTLSDIPITYRLVIATVSADSSLTLANTPSVGREIHVIIHNTSTSEIAITLPNSGNYVNTLDQVMTIDGSSYGEINLISDGNVIYIKYI